MGQPQFHKKGDDCVVVSGHNSELAEPVYTYSVGRAQVRLAEKRYRGRTLPYLYAKCRDILGPDTKPKKEKTKGRNRRRNRKGEVVLHGSTRIDC